MKRTQVVFLTGSLNLGGTERNILHLATRLDPRRFEVEVWSDYEGEPLQAALRARGVTCRSLKGSPSVGKPFLRRLLRHHLPYQWRLFRLARARREAVLHAFGFPKAYDAVLVGRLAGCRRIIFAVQDWDVWKRSGIYRLLDRACSRLARWVVADGRGAARLAAQRQGMDPNRLVTLYDGVDVDEIRPSRPRAETLRTLGLDPACLVIGMVARADIAKKGQDLFLAAIPAVWKEMPDAGFAMVGGGPDMPRLRRLAEGLPPGIRLSLTGFRHDLADVLAALDIVVIPSRWESVPKVLLEAMWLERPVVAARVGDIPEILDQDCGVLVEPNDPVALAEGILGLGRDRARRERLGRAARQRIRDRGLTLDASIRAYERLYGET